jgi:hypothetical protein
MKSYATKILMAVLAVMTMSVMAAADSPGRHPAYMHALTDLRNARAFLYYKPNVRMDADEQRAMDEIDAAIHEVTEAAIDDGKPMDDRPSSDTYGDRTDRLHHAMELLEKARTDVNEHESNGWSRDIRHQALHHIDQARKAVRHAIDREQHE